MHEESGDASHDGGGDAGTGVASDSRSGDASHDGGGDAGTGAATDSRPVDRSPIEPVSPPIGSSEGRDFTAGDKLKAEIERKLERSRSVNGFSKSGWDTLRDAQELYMEHLASEAIYEAQRNNDDIVGAKHVKLAMYSSGRTTLIKALEPLGGVLAGAGASQALVIIVSPSSRTTLSIVLTLSLIVVGVAILSIALARSWRP
jgi:hypothetical protein